MLFCINLNADLQCMMCIFFFMLYILVSSKVFAINLLPSIIYCQIFEFLFPKCSNGINCNCLVADMQYLLSDFFWCSVLFIYACINPRQI